jgi:molecular chaperone Hsp33
MADAIHRFLFEELDIRGVLVQLDVSWQAMLARREYSTDVRDLLGELAAVTAIIAGNLKSGNRMSFQLQGHGTVSLLVMDCQPLIDGPLHLRGMARSDSKSTVPHAGHSIPPASTPESSSTLNRLLGDGQLVLTLHQTDSQAYQSVVPLEGATMAAVFEHYLAQSEQQPARLWLSADEQSACGLFLQRLPGADQRDADGWNRVGQLAATVRADELRLPPEALIGRLFGDEAVRLFAPRDVLWHCPRDEEKVRRMLESLGREEVESMLEETGIIEVDDEICAHKYRFDDTIVNELFNPQKPTLH